MHKASTPNSPPIRDDNDLDTANESSSTTTSNSDSTRSDSVPVIVTLHQVSNPAFSEFSAVTALVLTFVSSPHHRTPEYLGQKYQHLHERNKSQVISEGPA